MCKFPSTVINLLSEGSRFLTKIKKGDLTSEFYSAAIDAELSRVSRWGFSSPVWWSYYKEDKLSGEKSNQWLQRVGIAALFET